MIPAPDTQPEQMVAVVPLLGKRPTEKARWLGALLSDLLTKQLEGAGLPVLAYNLVARHLTTSGQKLPLDRAGTQRLQHALKAGALIHGHYVLDEDAKMLGLRLVVEAEGVPRIPLEAAAPLATFPRFIERIALALIERLNIPIDEAIRQGVRETARPANFEAFRQLGEAQAAWARGENELALAAVESALALDPDLEEAAAIAAAIARVAGDEETTSRSFRHWSEIAARRKRPLDAAQRLLMLGHWLSEHGKWVEAQKVYEEARDIFKREEHDHGKAQAQNDLANLELQRGKIQSSIQTYRRSLRTFEETPGFERDAAITLYNLSLAHHSLGQTDEAMLAVEQAMSLTRQIKDARLQAYCMVQRGVIADAQGEWAKASTDYAQAARLFDVVGDEKGLAIVKSHQALLHKQQGSYERAEELMLQALDLLEEQGDSHGQAVVWFNLAELYLSMKLYDQAWDYAERAEETFSQLKSGWAPLAQSLIETLESIPEKTDLPSLQEDTYDSYLDQPPDHPETPADEGTTDVA